MTVANFLLVGNGTYLNHGCEAIVRGTMEILRQEFGVDTKVTLVTIGSAEAVRRQADEEYDPAITHVSINWEFNRWSKFWWQRQCNKFFGSCMGGALDALAPYLFSADAVLEIGGDNYSLDYGLPWLYIETDRYVIKHHRPLVLWGASVGPFDNNPGFARIMLSHLQKFSSILVRESLSYAYLRQHSSLNIFSVTDPAFVMKPIVPTVEKLGFVMPDEAIGINLSPLMARFVTKGDIGAWVDMCVEIVHTAHARFERPIVLIPHVTVPDNNDWILLNSVVDQLNEQVKSSVFLVPDTLCAAELKGVISKCIALVASRTHATIAGFSTHVPTLSLAYSVKAKGLNADLFGTQDYCLGAEELTADGVTRRLEILLNNRDEIKQCLADRMPDVERRAHSAGKILRQIITKESHELDESL